MKTRLENGLTYPVQALPEKTRLADLKAALTRSNHKSAKGQKAEALARSMEKEVLKGWSIPLQIDNALSIPNVEAAPHGLANQATINELG